jgi:aspartate/glutamate racemase
MTPEFISIFFILLSHINNRMISFPPVFDTTNIHVRAAVEFALHA